MALWGPKVAARADGPFRPDICWVCAQDGGYLGSCPHPYFSTVGAFRQSVLDGIRVTTFVGEIGGPKAMLDPSHRFIWG